MLQSQTEKKETKKSARQLWDEVAVRLRDDVGEIEYRSWLEKIIPAQVTTKKVVLALPNEFLRDSVRSRYSEKLLSLWRDVIPTVEQVKLTVGSGDIPQKKADSDLLDGEHVDQDIRELSAKEFPEDDPKHKSFGAALDKRYTFDTFVVGQPNEFAFACARRVADKPASTGLNPLFLHGNVGLGKTHLLHSIAAELIDNGYKDVIYMSAEKFTYLFVSALRSGKIIDFKDRLRSSDVLILDDMQFLLNKDNTQEEFYNTFNALVGDGRQIVLSADKPPTDLPGLEARLRTRLCSGMVADIHATTFELRLAILMNKVSASGVKVPQKVQEYLAHKITSSVRELEAALNRLIAYSHVTGHEISFETLSSDFMQDLLKPKERVVTIEEIQSKVSEHYNIRQSEMTSGRRARTVARPRQIAMYLSKELTSQSLPEIGRKFGNRDHTTVMHAVKKVADLVKKDKDFYEDVELLRRMLEG